MCGRDRFPEGSASRFPGSIATMNGYTSAHTGTETWN
jgi:hypothetical protein